MLATYNYRYLQYNIQSDFGDTLINTAQTQTIYPHLTVEKYIYILSHFKRTNSVGYGGTRTHPSPPACIQLITCIQ